MGNSIKRLEYEKPKEVDDKYHLFDEKKEQQKKDIDKKINIKIKNIDK